MGADNTFGETNFNPKMDKEKSFVGRLELIKAQQDYICKFVEFASGKYEVVNVVDVFGCLFVEIYDEPPSKHIDMIKLSSVKLL